MFVSLGAFFARISDPRIGGTYLVLRAHNILIIFVHAVSVFYDHPIMVSLHPVLRSHITAYSILLLSTASHNRKKKKLKKKTVLHSHTDYHS